MNARILIATLVLCLVGVYSASATTINVPEDYSTIQGAVDAASAGDTIVVGDGTYHEDVVVDKQLTIKSENGPENFIIDGGGSGSTVKITADGVKIKGLTVIHGDDGIDLAPSSSSNTITSNNISSNGRNGIYLWSSSGNIIYLNNFVDNNNNVHSSDSNIWSSTEEISYTYNGKHEGYLGNYWSDYNGSDLDGDGIGDTPYSINGHNDAYPLMQPFENYIAVTLNPPHASYSFKPVKPLANQSVKFNASTSYDSDGSITNYYWNFGDGTSATGEAANHTFTRPGSYNVTLTVTDNDGRADSTTKTITIHLYSPEATVSAGNVTVSKGGTGTADISVDEVPPEGLSYVNISVDIANSTVAQIRDVSFPDWATLSQNSSMPSSTVWFKVGDLNDEVGAGEKDVRLATVTVEGLHKGKSSIELAVSSFQAEGYSEIADSIAAKPGEVKVGVAPPPIGGKQPVDPVDLTGNGLYEDVNGDSNFNFGDVVFFFKNFDRPAVTGNKQFYDFNGDGAVNFGDVVGLFRNL